MKLNKKQILSSISVLIVASVIGGLLTLYFTPLKYLENAVKDIRIAIQPPEQQSKDIVIATITEETVSMFPYRSPIDLSLVHI